MEWKLESRKSMKLNKRNKKELRIICLFLLAITVIFLWIVQNIGFPIETKIFQGGKIKIIDVSSYNGNINWKKVKDQEINHAMLKIGSGINGKRKGMEDSRFSGNYRNAGYAAIHRGIYYYSYAENVTDARKEAKHCLFLMQKNGIDPTDLDLPVAYDVEEPSVFQTGKENVTAITVAFCEEIEKAGFTPMIYSGVSALNHYFDYDKIKKYKIWVAHYTNRSRPAVRFPYQMWQYTSKASVPGANTGRGYCDVSYYYINQKERK